MSDKFSQQKEILYMLSNGRISRKAFFYKGIASLTARISELRQQGHNIVCHRLPTLSDGKVRTEYELIKP